MKMNKSVLATMLALVLSTGSHAQAIQAPQEMKPSSNIMNTEPVTYQSVLPKGARLVAGNNKDEFFIVGRAEVPRETVEYNEPTYKVAEVDKSKGYVPVVIKEHPEKLKVALNFNQVGSRIKEALHDGDRKAAKSSPKVAATRKRAVSKMAMTHRKGVKSVAKVAKVVKVARVAKVSPKMAIGGHRVAKSVAKVAKASHKVTKGVSSVALNRHKVVKGRSVYAKSNQKTTKLRHIAVGGKVISV